jgi:hypothetical protein
MPVASCPVLDTVESVQPTVPLRRGAQQEAKDPRSTVGAVILPFDLPDVVGEPPWSTAWTGPGTVLDGSSNRRPGTRGQRLCRPWDSNPLAAGHYQAKPLPRQSRHEAWLTSPAESGEPHEMLPRTLDVA